MLIRDGSLIRPCLISPWTRLIGVLTIGLPAVTQDSPVHKYVHVFAPCMRVCLSCVCVCVCLCV